jgi:hypothetical protein
MSYFGVDVRNSVAIGLAGIASLFSGSKDAPPTPPAGGFIVLEVSGYLVQEVGTTPTNRFELE